VVGNDLEEDGNEATQGALSSMIVFSLAETVCQEVLLFSSASRIAIASCRRQPNFSIPMISNSFSVSVGNTIPDMACNRRMAMTSAGIFLYIAQLRTSSTVHWSIGFSRKLSQLVSSEYTKSEGFCASRCHACQAKLPVLMQPCCGSKLPLFANVCSSIAHCNLSSP
jgi:hypothetical protein